jgi:DNA polymerase II large subunit
MAIAASESIKEHFNYIDEEVKTCYSIAARARDKGYDPEREVPIPLARNMAERVVGLISVAAPQVLKVGIPERIQELEKEYGLLDWRVGMIISEEVASEKFCKFSDKREAMEVGIRVGFAYLTLGIVSAPLEGFLGLKIKKRKDGKEYFALQYAGPIRAAGGTAASVSVILSDYVRTKMGYSTYDAEEKEVLRYICEVNDYHERVSNLQYHPSEEELKFMLEHLPVEVDGDPTEKFQVSNYKDLPRIETNMIRGGVALVLAEGLSQKSSKLWKRLGKWGKSMGLEWDWLGDFIKLKEKIHAASSAGESKEVSAETKKKVKANNTFIMDLVAGRPVLTHPLAKGGFRLRYGRNRTSGFSSSALHPATLIVLNKFIAIGTQLKMERPGKASTVTICDTLEGPIVKLEDGSVRQISNEEEAKRLFPQIIKILFLGDILFNYGDFSENGQSLVPAGYCPEWWSLEAEKAIREKYTEDVAKASGEMGIGIERVEEILGNPLTVFPTFEEAETMSRKLNIPLHPAYTTYWDILDAERLTDLKNWLEKGRVKKDETGIQKIVLPYLDEEVNKRGKEILEELGIVHSVISKESVLIEKDEAKTLVLVLGFSFENGWDRMNIPKEELRGKDALEAINKISEIKLRAKGGTFVGARMGRPEKSKMRHLTGSPQVMFPVGDEGDRLRSFQSAVQAGKVTGQFPLFYCAKCKKQTIYPRCEDCGEFCEKKYNCKVCGDLDKDTCRHGKASSYKQMEIDIKHYFEKAKEQIGEKIVPELIKGIRGTSNKDHLVENLAKGILRAKHNIYVNKDGTTRYDCTELPLTHFKPKEVRTSLGKLKMMGYHKDITGKELENDDQLLELKPQDVILPGFDSLEESAPKVLTRVANFVDDLLVNFYHLQPYYKIKKEEDLVGHLVIGLAPHISAGLIGRIIGFSETQGLITHPMYHAGMRRDCDGDEAGVMLLMDALLNFSRQFLPEKRGAKSITPETIIYYRKNGEIKTEKIGLLVDKLLAENKSEARTEGDYEILSLGGYESVSFDSRMQKANFHMITKFVRHSSPPEIYEIKTSHGKIKVTGDHSVFVTKGKNIEQKEVRSLKEGEFLITLGKISLPSEESVSFDLLKLIDKKKIFVRPAPLLKESLKNLLKEKRKELKSKWKNSYYRYASNQHKIPLKFIEDCDLVSEVKTLYDRQGASVPRCFKIDENFVKISAYLISEGYLREGKTAEITNTNPEIIKEINDSIEKLTGSRIIVSWNKREGKKDCARIRLPSILKELFLAFGHLPASSGKKHLPNYLFSLSPELKEKFLEYYVKGDGHDYKKKNFKLIYSKSPYLAAELSLLIHSLGKKSAIHQGSRALQILYSEYNDTDCWWPLCDLTTELYGALRKEGLVKKEIQKILSNYRKNARNKSASIFSIKSIHDKLNHVDNQEIKKILKKIIDSDLKVEIVRKVSKTRSSDKYVYDLEVPEKQNFLCGPHPIFAHNTMDAPLVLTSFLNPTEVDDQVHGIDVAWKYPLELYEAALEMKKPWEVKFGKEQKKVEQLSDRLGTPMQFEGFGFTHKVENLNKGVQCSAYKILPSMKEKLFGQMDIAQKVRAVDMDDVARLVIERHFIRDIKGNLRKFSTQQFRCVKCNEKYRRPPLSGKCSACGGKLLFTITEGSIVKYLEPSLELASKYDFSPYLKQSLELIKANVDSIFGREKEKQVGLGNFMG